MKRVISDKVKAVKCDPPNLFVLLTSISIMFSIFWLIRTNGSCLDTIIFGSGNDRFMDFFNHITYVRDPKNLYFSSPHACFPPLIYLMYFLFSKMLPDDAIVMYDAFSTSSYALLLYIIYCMILGIFFFYSIQKLAKQKSIEFTLLITLLIVISNVFVFGSIERGNSALIVCILLLRSMELKDHEDNFSRETALICIAIASAIKIYPAIYGLIYLFEKRWKEARRLIIYGALFFFVPFLFFGGTDGFFQFFKNQIIIQTGSYRGMGSIRAFWNHIAEEWLHARKGGGYGMIIAMGYTILAMFGSARAKEFWKKTFLLSSIMIIAPFWSGRYTVIYLVIPLLLFLTKKQYENIDYLYAALFACMFLFLTYNNMKIAGIMATNFPSIIVYSAIYIMNILLIAESIIGFVKQRAVNVN